jgi:hypothetical protein
MCSPVWRLMRDAQFGPVIAYVMFVDGRPASPSPALRARMAWTSIVGAHDAPVLVTVAPEANWRELDATARREPENRLGAMLSQPGVIAQLARVGAP